MKKTVILLFVCYWYFFHFQYNKRLLRILPHLKRTDRILDFGCGKCCTTGSLIKKGYDVLGIDVVNEGTCYKPTMYDGYRLLNYPDNHFDVSICNFVLHHIPHYKQILSELQRVTKRGLIITEDTPANMFDRYLCSLHAGSDWGKCTDCFLSSEDWITLFKKMRFDIIEQVHISRFAFPFADRPFVYPVPRTMFVLNCRESLSKSRKKLQQIKCT